MTIVDIEDYNQQVISNEFISTMDIEAEPPRLKPRGQLVDFY